MTNDMKPCIDDAKVQKLALSKFNPDFLEWNQITCNQVFNCMCFLESVGKCFQEFLDSFDVNASKQ